MSAQLKFMSFNLRMDNKKDGINYFFNRFDRVTEVLDKEKPDVIGFQEVTDAIRAKLRDYLSDYTVQGCGRGKDCHGESMLIGYRKDAVELVKLENIWLSPTPEIPGSRYGGDQSGCPRMFTAALLKHKDAECPFWFINTHLDHEGALARYMGAMQIAQYISVHDEKFVLTGDFNATPETPEIKVVTDALAYRGAVDCSEKLGPTYHGFGDLSPEKWVKIDYIFSDAPCKASYLVEDIPVEGKYYSDHSAICTVLEME